MNLKQKVYYRFFESVNEKIHALQKILQELSDSAANETKSTAGDKHETALAMLQLEQENIRKQLLEAKEQKAVLEKIDITVSSTQIIRGSLVKTNKGYFFLSLAFGKIVVDDMDVIAVSNASPLGTKLLGAKINDIVEINGIAYVIENVE